MKPRKSLPRSTTPLKRSAPPKRKTRVKQRRATKRRSSRVHSVEYMAAVRELGCVVGRLDLRDTSCSGDIEAHHMGARGLGQKSSDLETIGFCAHHHRSWHDCNGVFAGRSKEWRREFASKSIAATQAALEGERVGGPQVIAMDLL